MSLIEEVEAGLKQVTPSPWSKALLWAVLRFAYKNPDTFSHVEEDGEWPDHDDAEFIAKAPEWLARLVAELKAANQKVEELQADADRLNWLEAEMFERRWDGTIGRPHTWAVVGYYRHILMRMRGSSLREAIDTAKQSVLERPL